MSAELTALALALLLHGAAMAMLALRARQELGSWPLGARDAPPPRPLSARLGRWQRIVANSFESLVLFAPAALMLHLAGQATPATALLGWIFLAARAAYVPAYAFGLVPWRSVVWAAGFLATLGMVLATLL